MSATEQPIQPKADKWGNTNLVVGQWDSGESGAYLASVFRQWKSRENTGILIATIREYIETIAQTLDEVRVGYLLRKNEEGVFGTRLELYQMQRLQDALEGLASMEEEPWLDFLSRLMHQPTGIVWTVIEPLISMSPFRGQMMSCYNVFLPEPNKPFTRGIPEHYGGHTIADIMAAKGIEFPEDYETDYIVIISPEALELIRVEARPHVRKIPAS